MDYPTLKRLATVALKNNFGWPKPPLPKPSRFCIELRDHINGQSSRLDVGLRDAVVELELLGPSCLIESGKSKFSFCRRAGHWQFSSQLFASSSDEVLHVVATEQSLQLSLAQRPRIESLLATGRLVVLGQTPADWVSILEDWLGHLYLRDL
jgi:hypothetical protein